MKCAQLLDSVSLVLRFLILVLKTGGPPFHLKKPLHVFERQLVSFSQFGEEALDRTVHDAAETKRGLGTFLQRPQISEQIPLGTFSVIVHSGRAELQRLWRGRMEYLRPGSDSRENLWRCGRSRKKRRVWRPCYWKTG